MSGLDTKLLHRIAGAGALAATAAVVACSGDQDVESPSPLMAGVSIEYPIELWDQGIEGTCIVKVRVNELGGVDSVLVIESSGHAAFDSAAIRGARSLRFRPARRGGKRIEVWAKVPVHFSKKPRP